MKTYRITGVLKARGIAGRDGGSFHLGVTDERSEYVDRRVLRDALGRPLLPGTSLRGVMAGIARATLRARGSAPPEEHSAFSALFGLARGQRGEGTGQVSRIVVRDSAQQVVDCSSLVRDRNGINRQRGSADDKRLFHDEVLDGAWSFPVEIEFTETGPRTVGERRLTAPAPVREKT